MKPSYIKPLLPLRDIVIFPSMVVPLFVGREKSIKALQEVMKTDKSIVLVTQKNSEIDDPIGKDLYQFGCLSKVLQLLKLPDGTVKVLVEGEKRVKVLKHNENTPDFLTCEVEIIEDQNMSKDLELFARGSKASIMALHSIVAVSNAVPFVRFSASRRGRSSSGEVFVGLAVLQLLTLSTMLRQCCWLRPLLANVRQ